MDSTGIVSSFDGYHPAIASGAYVDCSARLIGRVTIESTVLIWPGAVLRAEDEQIIIGEGGAVLDLCLLEAPDGYDVTVAKGALISHKACIQGATVRSGAIVGIGAIVLDGAVIGEGAIIGAGA